MIVPGACFMPKADGNLPMIVSVHAYGYPVDSSLEISSRKYDSARTSEPTWSSYFSSVLSTSLLFYSNTPNAVFDTGVLSTKTMNINVNKTHAIVAYKASWASDLADMSLEFLDSSDNVIAAIKTSTKSTYATKCEKGTSLSSLTEVTNVGTSNPFLLGELTFSSTQVVFTNRLGNLEYVPSFTIDCSATSITKVRASNVRVSTNYTGGTGGAYVFLQQRTLV